MQAACCRDGLRTAAGCRLAGVNITKRALTLISAPSSYRMRAAYTQASSLFDCAHTNMQAGSKRRTQRSAGLQALTIVADWLPESSLSQSGSLRGQHSERRGREGAGRPLFPQT